MSPSSTRLDRLEYLRGAASFYVLLHHFVRIGVPEFPDLPRYFRFGQAAVLLFFLLSGFVVHFATVGRDPNISFRSYFIRRFRRIFPIFAIALLISYASACVLAGRLVDPQLRELVLNLMQTQDRARPGNWATPYMDNVPLWSLSYEWWFYMLYFAIHRGLRAHRQKHWVFGISALGVGLDLLWPNPVAHVASYFVLWWIGVELCREYLASGRVTWRGQRFALIAAGVVTLLWTAPVFELWLRNGTVNVYDHPGLTQRHFVTTLVIVGVGWVWYRAGLVGFDATLRVFGYVAPLSYCLYVCHMPLIEVAAAWRLTGSGVVDFFVVTPPLMALCWFIEQPMQRWINRRLPQP